VFISEALEWLCGFHAVCSLWHWVINRKEKEWGRITGVWRWIEPRLPVGHMARSHTGGKSFRM
jgi:hypothetical protein